MNDGGVSTGWIVGASNAFGEFVIDNPVAPQDAAATVYHALGVVLHTRYRSEDRGPIDLVPTGKPVGQLVGEVQEHFSSSCIGAEKRNAGQFLSVSTAFSHGDAVSERSRLSPGSVCCGACCQAVLE
jgi:hypothetical protein